MMPMQGVPDLGGLQIAADRVPSKAEQFRIMAINAAMGLEQGRVEAYKSMANATERRTITVGDMATVLKDAEKVIKFITTGH